MKITGYLSEFSLGEIFRFLEQGQKTGCLSIKPIQTQEDLSSTYENQEYYIFFRLGQIVAASPSLDHQGLQDLIERRGWLRKITIQRLLSLCPRDLPSGVCLKAQGALDPAQLQLLFKQQVLTPIPQLFSLDEGWFKFDAHHPLPYEEMTGLSASPMEIAVAGLRLLKDWTALMDKLPLPDSTIVSAVSGQPPYHLNSREWQVWEHVNSAIKLKDIATALQLPVLEVQKVCFRLMVAGLVEEIASIAEVKTDNAKANSSKSETKSETTEISSSFLQGVLTFLRTTIHV
ncbi:MAG: DUF4388 domain-containing protein [Thermostichus sp. DG02_2_bins_29]